MIIFSLICTTSSLALGAKFYFPLQFYWKTSKWKFFAASLSYLATAVMPSLRVNPLPLTAICFLTDRFGGCTHCCWSPAGGAGPEWQCLWARWSAWLWGTAEKPCMLHPAGAQAQQLWHGHWWWQGKDYLLFGNEVGARTWLHTALHRFT